MITVSFKFETVEAAVEFLETQGRESRPQVDENAPRTNTGEAKQRKPRSDAGQPRGPYKRKDEEAAAPVTVPAETPPAAPVAAAGQDSAAPQGGAPLSEPTVKPTGGAAAAELTLADVRAAMTGRNTEKNIALLGKFGYAKSSDLPQAKYAEFIAACKRGE